ncbi:unnamed protein product [Victoria cruziana]
MYNKFTGFQSVEAGGLRAPLTCSGPSPIYWQHRERDGRSSVIPGSCLWEMRAVYAVRVLVTVISSGNHLSSVDLS